MRWRSRGHGLEIRVNTTVHGLTWSGERWLHHSVVLGVEGKQDGVTDRGMDSIGQVNKFAVGHRVTAFNRESWIVKFAAETKVARAMEAREERILTVC